MKKGTWVKMVNCAEAEKHQNKFWKTRSEPWDVCGTMCVLLEGYSGAFAVDCLEIVEGPQEC